MKLKLFLLKQNVVDDYDTFDSCVVAAPSAYTATRIHPQDGAISPCGMWAVKTCHPTWATDCNDVSAEYIGETHINEISVILASFNAG